MKIQFVLYRILRNIDNINVIELNINFLFNNDIVHYIYTTLFRLNIYNYEFKITGSINKNYKKKLKKRFSIIYIKRNTKYFY